MVAAVDLEGLADGDAVQDHLVELTGSRSVPKVYIGGELVGGCDDTMALYSESINHTRGATPTTPGFQSFQGDL